MSEAALPVAKSPARRRAKRRPPLATNVIHLHQHILPRHTEYLSRWFDAGRPMGLHDATIHVADRMANRGADDYVLIWVRENVDPAYLVRPEGLGWVVVDSIREIQLGRTRTFAAALHLIRPVLDLDEAA